MIIIINYIASLCLYLVQWLIECNCYALGTIFKKCACHINTKKKALRRYAISSTYG